MMIQSKHEILKRLRTFFQKKPDHVRHSLSQFLLDLLGPKVTTPVIIPGKRDTTPKSLNLTNTSCVVVYHLNICEYMIR